MELCRGAEGSPALTLHRLTLACLVKHVRLEREIKAKNVFPALPGGETARTKPPEVKCNRIKTLYVIIDSQREKGPPAFASSLQTDTAALSEGDEASAQTPEKLTKHLVAGERDSAERVRHGWRLWRGKGRSEGESEAGVFCFVGRSKEPVVGVHKEFQRASWRHRTNK